ncbi:hypothetical protein Nepgr_020484 [Nepenthes gracilis]|uniref:Uncharacterized protein n=1 Tax=Nepenthes gracilis TaxID=150966 RepID=A0AAD3XV96_NEPGR|nr:hypothetical protein Nepgr_020484 [Nepenthes gracilis]
MAGLPVNRGVNQQQRPMFNIMESIVQTQSCLAKPTLTGASFASYHEPNDPIVPTKHRADDSKASISEKNFNGVHDQRGNEAISSKQSNPSSMPRFSSVPSVDNGYGRNHLAGSFHDKPTASSEASWNSLSGLLSNHPGSLAVSIKSLHNSADKHTKSPGWFLWWKCPCSGKKSVQVEHTNRESENQQIFQFNRINSNGSYAYSSNRQSSSSSSISSAYAGKGIISLSNDQDNRNFTAPHRFDQSKIIDPGPSVSPNLSGFPANRCLLPNQGTANGRSFTDNNRTTGNVFTFPIMNSSIPSVKRMLNVIPPAVTGASVEDLPRYSLEVFKPREPPQLGGRERRNVAFSTSQKSRWASYDDDNGSDASSDLFEIESFSTQSTSYPRRDSLDENSSFNVRGFGSLAENNGFDSRQSLEEPAAASVAPTEYYAPSTPSIDWSVMTAEEFGSATLTNLPVVDNSQEWVPELSLR